HASNNYDYLEAIFDTIPDDDILAALSEVVQDQDQNTTSQSTIELEDEDSEDEPLIKRRPGWKSVSDSEPIAATQFEDEGEDDMQRPLTQDAWPLYVPGAHPTSHLQQS
ncbi:hypothetical protein BGX33_002564, partial [Mortierella sp. NVP41]